MRDYTKSLTHINVKKHERLYNITDTNQKKGNMRDYTTSLTHIKVKKHERLYNITHINQNKET